MTSPVRALIVDDDPLSRTRIRALLEEDGEVEVVREAGNGREGAEAIRALSPDLVFLDVQMPALDGFGLVEEIGAARMPVTVFVSAYVEFALRAFEAYALDYLLKPFEDERFASALGRAKQHALSRTTGLDPRLGALLEHLREPRRQPFPEVLAIRNGDQYPLVRVEDIDYIVAEDNYARVHLGGTSRLISKTLTGLERKVLDPDRFIRIHRSTIVNLGRVVSVEPLFHGEYSVRLRDGTHLTCSRRYRQQLRSRIYFTS